MVTTQAAVIVIADILPAHEAPLRQLLATANQDPANNALVPFGKLPTVHFARFFIMDPTHDLRGRSLPGHLVLDADVDGSGDAFLVGLCNLASAGLHTIYAHCTSGLDRSGLLDFLRAHTNPVFARYVNTIGRTVAQIRQEAALREAIQGFLDRHWQQWRRLPGGAPRSVGADPRHLRAAIQEFVEREPSLAWARRGVPPPEPSYVLREAVHVLLVGIAGTVLFPVTLLGLPVWLFLLRQHEQTEVARDVSPDDAFVQALAAQEDHGVQNPFTSFGFVKLGPFRLFTGTLALWAVNFLSRHVFNHANLLGIKSIHFAHWVFIDEKRRVIFSTNYDGSLENYMDDFVDKIAWGLNASFSHAVDYPRTNWLVRDGARDEQVFKRFNVSHQLVTQFWYAAYQGLTALNIDNNARIRAGLYGAMDDAATRAWLRRF